MTTRLIEQYDGLVCDLDGVVYAGPSAVPHAVESLVRAGRERRSVVYATNNASRPGTQVAEHLSSLGLPCQGDEVINSSVAGAHVLRQLDAGERVLVVGGEGVGIAVRDAGLVAVSCTEHRNGRAVDAVLQGYGAEVSAADLAEAAYAIQGGALWVATNTDRTLPTDRGQAPGNGSLVGAVRCAVDREPVVAGKPEPVMYELATEHMQTERSRVLAIGDRLETDIEGAVAGGFDSALVLTGVHGWRDAAAAPEAQRPTYVLQDLRSLFDAYDVAEIRSEDDFRAAKTTSQLRGALRYAWAMVDEGEWSREDSGERFKKLLNEAQDVD